MDQPLLAFFVRGMTMEGPRRSKFAELVADHVLGHGDRNMLVAVMHAERDAHELRQGWWTGGSRS